MGINFEGLTAPLTVDEIEFRIQSINRGGYATLLAYKNARTDIERLNKYVGHLGWERIHSRDNRNCTVRIWDDNSGHWVSKEDTGTESNAEAQKGLASDSFKRACFNWGIGIELYAYPKISIKLLGDGTDKKGEWFLNEQKKDKYGRPSVQPGYALKLVEWSWYSEFSGNKLSFLAAKDNHGTIRFKYGERK